ncbi:MAG: hypothetical protein Fur006_07880 [Coleofasciculaceae cyanobacterium]
MKPNFEAMSNKELRAYALTHRGDEDIEALRVLFSRRSSDSEATLFYLPKTQEEEQQQFELFKQIVSKIETKKDFHNLEEELQKERELEEKIRQKLEKEIEEELRAKIERELEDKIRQKLEEEIEEKLRQKIEKEKDQETQS